MEGRKFDNMTFTKIIHGDSLKVLPTFPQNSIDICITSPPYNVSIDYSFYNDNKTSQDYHTFMRKVWNEVYRVIRPGGRICLNIPFTTSKPNRENFYHNSCLDLESAGFTYRDVVVWNKTQASRRTAWGSWKQPSNPWVVPTFESIAIYHKESPKMIGKKEDADITRDEFIEWSNSMWNFPGDSTVKQHPATYPKELPKRCMKFWSFKNCVVLDPFLGAGTTTLVAKDISRNSIGIEIDKKYVDIALQRTFGEEDYDTVTHPDFTEYILQS